MEDSFLDSALESQLMGETPFFAPADLDEERDPYGFEFEDGRYDDDPSVYEGSYSEE